MVIQSIWMSSVPAVPVGQPEALALLLEDHLLDRR
jgi:hypothetical protein